MLCEVIHCAKRVSVNTRDDREMGTTISCTECSQVADLEGLQCTVSLYG